MVAKPIPAIPPLPYQRPGTPVHKPLANPDDD